MAAIYYKYIRNKILFYFCVTISVVVLSIWLVQSIKMFELLAKSSGHFFLFLQMIICMIAPLIYFCIPIALLIAVVLFIHNINSNSELLLLKTSGVANKTIYYWILSVVSAILLLHFTISAYIMPISYKKFQEIHIILKNNILNVSLEEGVFNHYGKKLTIFVEKKIDDNVYQNIMIHDCRDEKRDVMLIAKYGEFFLSKNSVGVKLSDCQNHSKNMDSGYVDVGMFHEYNFNIAINAGKYPNIYTPKHTNEMFLNDLLLMIKKNDDGNYYIAQIFNRVFWPVIGMMTVIMVLRRMIWVDSSYRDLKLKESIKSFCFGLSMLCIFIIGINLASKHPAYLAISFFAMLLTFFVK